MLGSPKCTVGRTRDPGRPGRAGRQDDGALGVGSCTVRGPKLRPDSHIRRCSRKPAGTSRPVCAPPTNVDPGQIAPASFLSREDEIVHRKTFLLDTCESGGCALRIGLREFEGPKVGLPDRDLGHRRLCPRSRCEKRISFEPFYTFNMITLPRHARDKHGGNSKGDAFFRRTAAPAVADAAAAASTN